MRNKRGTKKISFRDEAREQTKFFLGQGCGGGGLCGVGAGWVRLCKIDRVVVVRSLNELKL